MRVLFTTLGHLKKFLTRESSMQPHVVTGTEGTDSETCIPSQLILTCHGCVFGSLSSLSIPLSVSYWAKLHCLLPGLLLRASEWEDRMLVSTSLPCSTDPRFTPHVTSDSPLIQGKSITLLIAHHPVRLNNSLLPNKIHSTGSYISHSGACPCPTFWPCSSQLGHAEQLTPFRHIAP